MKTQEREVQNLNLPVTLAQMSKLFLENNIILLNAMDEKIKKNNEILIPMLSRMMDEKIAKNNTILAKMMDEKIKANNELIFDNFNDQTTRLLNLFSGVLRVRKDGSFKVDIL